MSVILVLGAAATGFRAIPHPAPPTMAYGPRCSVRACAAAPAITVEIKPPVDREQMLSQAVGAVTRAREAGRERFILRLFLPRGDGLSPADESWEGGIMQLYASCSPLVRELLRRLSTEVAGVPPALTEQRIDASGVDGESVWFAQSAKPEDDGVALVQPMTESIATIRKLSSDAGVPS